MAGEELVGSAHTELNPTGNPTGLEADPSLLSLSLEIPQKQHLDYTLVKEPEVEDPRGCDLNLDPQKLGDNYCLNNQLASWYFVIWQMIINALCKVTYFQDIPKGINCSLSVFS